MMHNRHYSAVQSGHANIVDLFLANKRLKLTDEVFETFGSYSEQQRLKFKELNDKYKEWLNKLKTDILYTLYNRKKVYKESLKLSINVLRGLKQEIESKMLCAGIWLASPQPNIPSKCRKH